MDYEFQEWDNTDFEDARKLLLDTANSKNQHHLWYIAGVVVALIALISQYNVFFNLPQNPISIATLLFFVIVSAIIASIFYLLKRACYWTTYGSAILNLSVRNTKQLFQRYISKEKHKGFREQVNPLRAIINGAAAQHLEDIQTTKKLKLTAKIAVINGIDTIFLSLAVFYGFLLHFS